MDRRGFDMAEKKEEDKIDSTEREIE